MIFAWSTVTVLWDPAIFPDQPWASQRLVPVVLARHRLPGRVGVLTGPAPGG